MSGGYPEPYKPSPQEIRQACERLQAEWTPEEEKRRRLPYCGKDCRGDLMQDGREAFVELKALLAQGDLERPYKAANPLMD